MAEQIVTNFSPSDKNLFISLPGRRLAAVLRAFVYTNSAAVSIHSEDNKIQVSVVGNAAALVLELRRLADELENKLFFVSHRRLVEQASTSPGLAPTPEQVIAYFEQSPILSIYAADVRAVLSSVPSALSQVESDFVTVRPFLSEIVAADGRVNKSAIARCLGIAPGGAGWRRIKAVEQFIISSSSPPELQSVHDAERLAA